MGKVKWGTGVRIKVEKIEKAWRGEAKMEEVVNASKWSREERVGVGKVIYGTGIRIGVEKIKIIGVKVKFGRDKIIKK